MVTNNLMKKFNYELSNQKWSMDEVNFAFGELSKSNLASEGVFAALEHKKGVQRYPLDPLNSLTWDEILQ